MEDHSGAICTEDPPVTYNHAFLLHVQSMLSEAVNSRVSANKYCLTRIAVAEMFFSTLKFVDEAIWCDAHNARNCVSLVVSHEYTIQPRCHSSEA